MSEDPRERARAYLAAIEFALKTAENINEPRTARIIDYVKRYVADSKYYLKVGKPTTALASVAYAEGLLDSLSILGIASMKSATH